MAAATARRRRRGTGACHGTTWCAACRGRGCGRMRSARTAGAAGLGRAGDAQTCCIYKHTDKHHSERKLRSVSFRSQSRTQTSSRKWHVKITFVENLPENFLCPCNHRITTETLFPVQFLTVFPNTTNILVQQGNTLAMIHFIQVATWLTRLECVLTTFQHFSQFSQ